jgi:D-ribulokinase
LRAEIEFRFMVRYRLGIDFGTSGARAIVIDSGGEIVAQARVMALGQTAADWRSALEELLAQLPQSVRSHISGIAVNGTSSTVLLCAETGEVLLGPLMYDDARSIEQVEWIRSIAPPHHTVINATSSFAKLRWFASQPEFEQAKFFLHQADWLAFLLHGKLGISDYHNALKLGYDVENLCYPQWLLQALPSATRSMLPEVRSPGSPVAPIQSRWCDRFGFSPDCMIHTGTTDSIAAFLASGASETGEAVTSLGSTLVIKLLSETRIEDARYGIYSHRLRTAHGDRWLVGGASNTGGAVLQAFFTSDQLASLSAQIDPAIPTGLDYYPLLKPGDRFPINDPDLAPRLDPQPSDDRIFLQGMLESMSRIEAQAYQRLQTLGASPLTRIYTAGGGAQNPVWQQMRSKAIGLPILPAPQTEAAYGSACLIYVSGIKLSINGP